MKFLKSNILLIAITPMMPALHAAEKINYEDHILPIFEQSCNNCHNPDKQKGDLDLTTYTALMRGGSGGKIAEPGEGGDSKLYGVITHTLKPKMPPKGEKLSKKDADTIRAWIDEGLLENKSGKPKKKKKPSFTVQASSGLKKPDGPRPLPKHVLLEPVVQTQRATAVADMVISPWAPLLAVTGQRQVILYHTDTLEMVGILPFPAGQPESLTFHPSGKYLMAGGGIAGKSGTTVTWEVPTGKVVLVSGKDFDSCIASALRSDLGGVSFGGPGKRVKLWDVASDEQLISIKKHTDWVTKLTYSPDGVLLASGGRGGGVYVWEAETGNPFHTLRAHQGSITGLDWRNDSNLLASASEDGSVIIWEMNNGRQVKKINAHGGGVLSLDWNKNGGGYLVTSGRDMRVKIWKPDFNPFKTLPAFPTIVTEVAMSHDGKRVFAGDLNGVITVWDVATAKQIGTIAANPPSIQNRIIRLTKQLDNHPKSLAKVKGELQAATELHGKRRAELEQIRKRKATSEAEHKRLIQQRTQLDSQLKQLNVDGQKLQQLRAPLEQKLHAARDALKSHNQLMRDTQQQKTQLENQVRKLDEQQKQLADRERKAREHAAQHPEDAPAQEAASQAKQALEKHQQALTSKRQELTTKTTALAQLTAQQKNPGNQLAAADKAMKDWFSKWNAHHAKRKPIAEKRAALTKPIQTTQQQLQQARQQLKPAEKSFAVAEKAYQQAAASYKWSKDESVKLRHRIQHWKAAAINTDALRLRAEHQQMNQKQNDTIDRFTALAAEIQQLKDPAKLNDLTKQLQQLRREIDQSTSKIIRKNQDASAKEKQYRAAL